jgi:ABC-type antimicrobial peptide transport system permease subunit
MTTDSRTGFLRRVLIGGGLGALFGIGVYLFMNFVVLPIALAACWPLRRMRP